MRRTRRQFLTQSRGQDLIEYALLSAGIALLLVAATSAMGGSLDSWYSLVGEVVDVGSTSLPDPGNPDGPGGGRGNGRGRGSGGSNCSAQGIASSGGKCQ